MTTLLSFLWNLLGTLPIVSALLLVATANVRRIHRVRQTPIPLVAGIYSVLALVILYHFNDAVLAVLTWWWELWPQSGSQPGQTWLYVWENVLILLIFMVLKFLAKPFLARLFRDGRSAAQALTAGIYYFDPSAGLWFIERRFSDLRGFLRVFYWVSLALTILVVALAGTFSDWPIFAAVSFPAIAVLLIGEVYFAVDGLNRGEYSSDITGEADRSTSIANYGPLRRVLRELFPTRVLSDGVHLSSTASLNSGFRVSELGRGDDEAEKMAGAYFRHLSGKRRDLDVNLVDASVELLRGNSVLINNPFYVDLTTYLSLPAYYNLLQYRKVLVVAGRDSLAEDLTEWIEHGLEEITGVPDLWRAGLLTSVEDDALDVGVLRFADVHDLELLRRNDEFLSQVGYVILAEPARMMSTGQMGLSLLLSRCSQIEPPTFAALDGNHDGLVDALSHLLKTSLTEVVASALPRGASSEVVWKAEGPSLQSMIMPKVSRYLGVGTEVGAVALKYQVKEVHWVGADAFPVTDMMWIAGQYYAQINAFADLDLSQDALRDALIDLPNPWAVPQRNNYFLIVEDEEANAYETIRRFSTRATSTGFINLISPDYLLRDYMVDNHDLFSADPKAIPSIVPDFARTERNTVLRLILSLLTFGVTGPELRREFELIGWPVSSESPKVTDGHAVAEPLELTLLRRAIAEHTGVTGLTIDSTTEIDPSTSGDGVRLVLRYRVAAGTGLDQAVSSLRAAYFYVEDELEETNRIGALLYDHVYQALLPGQFIVQGGKYYEVQSIGPDGVRSGVVLRRAADHIRGRLAYRQLRSFTVSRIEVLESLSTHMLRGQMELVRAKAAVQVRSLGYLELPSRSDLSGGRRVTIDGLPARRYVNKSLLVVRFPGISPEVRRTIALLLNELFVTVFPHSYNYLSAVTSDPDGVLGDLLPGFTLDNTDEHSDDLSDAILIVEDSTVDLGLIVAVERHWERLLETITDYLVWNSTPLPVREDTPVHGPLNFPDRLAQEPRLPWWKRWLKRLTRRGDEATGPTRTLAEGPSPIKREADMEDTQTDVPEEEPDVSMQPGEELAASQDEAQTPEPTSIMTLGGRVNQTQGDRDEQE